MKLESKEKHVTETYTYVFNIGKDRFVRVYIVFEDDKYKNHKSFIVLPQREKLKLNSMVEKVVEEIENEKMKKAKFNDKPLFALKNLVNILDRDYVLYSDKIKSIDESINFSKQVIKEEEDIDYS